MPFLICILIWVISGPQTAFAERALGGFPFSGLPRKILALYHIQKNENFAHTPAHRYAEVILNHLGLEVVHRSVLEPYPNEEEMKGFLGILTWFQGEGQIPEPQEYCRWLSRQIHHGKKVVILEYPGFLETGRRIPPACQVALRALGVEYLENFSDNPYFFEIVDKDPGMVEFERKLLMTENLHYSQYRVLSPKAKVHLRARRIDLENGKSDLVFTTPRGGFAHATHVNFKLPDIGKIQWRLNPFRFFEEAFGIQGLPRPDVTTRNGRRVFFSHIDGDGIVNLSHIDNESFSGEILYREILKPTATIPITASIITGYLDMRAYRGERVIDLYRDIFSLPHVEAVSHGHAHPLIWEEGKLALKVPGFHYTPELEIKGSVEKLRGLLKSLGINKPVNLFSWTGDCLPTESQMAIPHKIGVKNLNGGDPRFDKRYDSLSFLLPLSLLRGGYRQIYTAAPNENMYTNKWKGPYYGYVDVIETFQGTENPVRLKPINVYYHYYSGERIAALKALKTVYQYALSQEIFPVFATEYVAMVEDFFKTKIIPLEGGWRIANDGFLKTIRFDHEKRNVDLSRSRGVLGYRHERGSLYVFLGEGTAHDIFLTSAQPVNPYIEAATFLVRDFKGDREGLGFFKSGWHKSEAVLGGMTPKKIYHIQSEGEAWEAKSDSQGKLKIVFRRAENGSGWREVKIKG